MKKTLITLSISMLAFAPITLPFAQAQGLTVTTVKAQFKRSLTLGSVGEDVQNLQRVLNGNETTVVAGVGKPGGPGTEGMYFGPATRKAVIAFQKLHNITPASGFVGPKTITVLNTLVINPVTPPSIIGMNVDTTNYGTARVELGYTGGGEEPTIWFVYGSSPETMSIKSEVYKGTLGSGTSSISISGLGGSDCYVRAYIKNSEGMTSSEIKRCVK